MSLRFFFVSFIYNQVFSNGSLTAVLCGKKEYKELQETVNPFLFSPPGGCLTLLFHSDYSNIERHSGFRGFYTVQGETLKRILKDDVFIFLSNRHTFVSKEGCILEKESQCLRAIAAKADTKQSH